MFQLFLKVKPCDCGLDALSDNNTYRALVKGSFTCGVGDGGGGNAALLRGGMPKTKWIDGIGIHNNRTDTRVSLI